MGTAAVGVALLASAFFSALAVHAACTNPTTIPSGLAAQCYKGPGLNQCNTGAWRVQSFNLTAAYAYSQSTYYAYSQSAYTSSTNLGLGILPTASAAFGGNPALITDGDTNTANWVEVGSGGAQWVKLDLGNTYSLNDVKVWHYYGA